MSGPVRYPGLPYPMTVLDRAPRVHEWTVIKGQPGCVMAIKDHDAIVSLSDTVVRVPLASLSTWAGGVA